MSINAEWHRANPMPKHPTLEQRLEWHHEHALHCGLPQAAAEARRAARRVRNALHARLSHPLTARFPGWRGARAVVQSMTSTPTSSEEE